MLFDLKKSNQFQGEALGYYKTIGSVWCPYFQEKVFFTSEGFNHIRYRRARNQRHFKARLMRYRLLKLAPMVIANSKTLQEYEVQNLFVEVKKEKQRESILKMVQFFGFIAIIKDWKIKVIVRQIGEGQKHFWSIIPNWKTRLSRDGKKFSIKHTGNLAED